MHYITHITLTTGHMARQHRGDVREETMAVLVPWLSDAIASGQREPIPAVPGGYTALALKQDGALVVTVYCRDPEVGSPEPLATFGVAPRSRSAVPMWALLTSTQPHVLHGLRMPSAPWCAAVPYNALAGYTDVLEWLGDFERCIAWAWVSRHPGLISV